VLLAEAALRAIPATPNNYLDEGESITLDVLVLDRGNPSKAGIVVTLVNPDTATSASVTSTTNAEGIATRSTSAAGPLLRRSNERPMRSVWILAL
jgi:hypothetical protein